MTLSVEFKMQEECMINACVVTCLYAARIIFVLTLDTQKFITVHVIILSVGYQIAVMNECRSMNGLEHICMYTNLNLIFVHTSIDKNKTL